MYEFIKTSVNYLGMWTAHDTINNACSFGKTKEESIQNVIKYVKEKAMAEIKLPANATIKYEPHGGGWYGELQIGNKVKAEVKSPTVAELIGRLIEKWSQKKDTVVWQLPSSRIEIIGTDSGFTGVLYIDGKEEGRTEQSNVADVTMALVRDWNMKKEKGSETVVLPGGWTVKIQDNGTHFIATYNDPAEKRDNIIGVGDTIKEAIGDCMIKYHRIRNGIQVKEI